jgi:methyl-accepting chemotaxis protein
MDTKNKRGKKMGIAIKLIGLAIMPAALAILVLLLYARYSLQKGLSSEAIDGLELLAEATAAGYGDMEGDYWLDESGDLWKGENNLSERIDEIDAYTESSSADVTICYGKTRKLTSLIDSSTQQRIVGTDVSDAVWEVVQAGGIYETTSIVINGKDYFACYMPLRNSDDSIVGIVFAGEPADEAQAYINERVANICYIALFTLIFAALFGYIVARDIAKCLVSTKNSLTSLAEGNLAVTVEPHVMKRHDEIGDMGVALMELVERLTVIVSSLKASSDTLYEAGNTLDEMAGQSSAAADEISHAVEDISKGAVSQADEIQNASREISTMGSVIENIVDNVGSLTNVSKNMSTAGDASVETMQELSESNDRTTEAVARIASHIQMTNTSIQKISDAAALITFITDQTSLLALNASIESARAGEAGKGFAVVATEIQNLAVQSDGAAADIQKIIGTLQSESEQTMAIMNETEALIKEQQDKLDATKTRFKEVSSGINASREDTDIIRSNADTCDSSRVQVMDVISNLSSISEQNAASAEETTASMQELNATINMLAESAKNLKALSTQLNENMSFFKL